MNIYFMLKKSKVWFNHSRNEIKKNDKIDFGGGDKNLVI